MSGQPKHVASGGFRIDRSKALEKLAEHQMPDPKRFLLPWLRCAQASGATRADVLTTWNAVELSFDGSPLAPRFHREPFDALFAEEADAGRHRDLATGLLTAFRLGTENITVISGHGHDRLKLSGTSAEDAIAEPYVDGIPRTILAVTWKGKFENLSAECAEAASMSGRMLPFPVYYNGSVSWAEPPQPYVLIEKAGTRVRVSIPEDPGARDTFVKIHKRGVLAGSIPIDSPIEVQAEIDRDDFVLDASQTTAVRDQTLESALREVPGAIDSLIAKACELQRNFPGLAASLFTPAAEPLRRRMSKGDWASRLRALATDWTRYEGGGTAKACSEFEARVTRWLRIIAARNLAVYSSDSDQPAARALWETPLYLGVDGKGLSLLALREQCEKRGLVPVAREVRPKPKELDIIWLPDGPDGTLEALFPDRVQEMDDLLKSLANTPKP